MENIVTLISMVGVIPALFIWLLYNNRKDSKERENKYIQREELYQEQIKENGAVMSEIAVTLKNINDDIKGIKEGQNDMEKEIAILAERVDNKCQ